MMTFLLGLLLLPTLIVIATPRPTYAEGLLNGVGCLVRSLLDVNCSSQPTSPPANPTTSPPQSTPSSTPAQAQSSPSSPPTSTPTSSSSASVRSQSLAINPTLSAPIADVQPVTPIGSSSGTQFTTNAAYAVPKIGSSLLQPPYDTGNTAPIQATDQGWRILGALWYWWLTAIVGLVGSTMILIARTRAPQLALHKRSSLLK